MEWDWFLIQTKHWFGWIVGPFVKLQQFFIPDTYSSLSSGTHHIVFTRRLQVVALEEYANGFPADTRHEFSRECFLRYQTNRPPGLAFGRWTATHRHNALCLLVVEQPGGTGTLPVIESPLEATGTVAIGSFSNGLGCKFKQTGDLWCGHAVRKPEQGQYTQSHPDLLNPSEQQIVQVLLVLHGSLMRRGRAEGRASHTSKIFENV